MTPQINIIAAIGKDTRALGKNGDLIWKIPADMKKFKELTVGHPVIMGRKTWESIPERYRPLDRRTNIVVTKSQDIRTCKVFTVPSIEAALALASDSDGNDQIFIIGGAEIYKAALPLAHRLILTLVESDEAGDVFFPEYEGDGFHQTLTEPHKEEQPAFTFAVFER